MNGTGAIVASGWDEPGRFFLAPFDLPFMAHALVELLVVAVLGGTVGVFVLLRRLAYETDAITHTVFPGIVAGYLVSGYGGVLWGALVAGCATAVVLAVLTAGDRVSDDSALSIVLTTFFALGVIMVSRMAGYTTNLTAFLFGQVLGVGVGQIVVSAVVAAFALVALAVLHRPLLLRAFDPEGARATGYRVELLDLALNLVIALVVVAAARAVGTVLVVGFLVVPAAAARVLSDRLAVIVPMACLVGAVGSWLGLAISFRVSVAHDVALAASGTVVLVVAAIYVCCVAGAALTGTLRRAGWRRGVDLVAERGGGEAT